MIIYSHSFISYNDLLLLTRHISQLIVRNM